MSMRRGRVVLNWVGGNYDCSWTMNVGEDRLVRLRCYGFLLFYYDPRHLTRGHPSGMNVH